MTWKSNLKDLIKYAHIIEKPLEIFCQSQSRQKRQNELHGIPQMGQKDREFGSQADLIKNEAGMGTTNPDTNPEAEITRGILSRTQSKRSEFETVSYGRYG